MFLSEGPTPPADLLDRIVPPPMPPREVIDGFKWPERLDPALRQATELEFDDDPELRYHDTSSDASDRDSNFGDDNDDRRASVAVGRGDARRFSIEHNLRCFNERERRRRADIERRLQKIYGTNAAANGDESGSPAPSTDYRDELGEVVEVDCSHLRGGKAFAKGMPWASASAAQSAPLLCVVCELDEKGVARCLCGAWVHRDCAHETDPLRCGSGCVPSRVGEK